MFDRAGVCRTLEAPARACFAVIYDTQHPLIRLFIAQHTSKRKQVMVDADTFRGINARLPELGAVVLEATQKLMKNSSGVTAADLAQMYNAPAAALSSSARALGGWVLGWLPHTSERVWLAVAVALFPDQNTRLRGGLGGFLPANHNYPLKSDDRAELCRALCSVCVSYGCLLSCCPTNNAGGAESDYGGGGGVRDLSMMHRGSLDFFSGLSIGGGGGGGGGGVVSRVLGGVGGGGGVAGGVSNNNNNITDRSGSGAGAGSRLWFGGERAWQADSCVLGYVAHRVAGCWVLGGYEGRKDGRRATRIGLPSVVSNATCVDAPGRTACCVTYGGQACVMRRRPSPHSLPPCCVVFCIAAFCAACVFD